MGGRRFLITGSNLAYMGSQAGWMGLGLAWGCQALVQAQPGHWLCPSGLLHILSAGAWSGVAPWDFQWKRRDFCRGEVGWALPPLFWLPLSPTESFPHGFLAAALHASSMGSLAEWSSLVNASVFIPGYRSSPGQLSFQQPGSHSGQHERSKRP